MKTLLIATAALSLLGAAGAASAQPYPGARQDRNEIRHDQAELRHDKMQARQHARWARGQHLPRNYWTNQYVVNDWRARRLHAPPRGYQWRRVDNNYVLAAATTGLIAEIIASSR